MIRWLTTILQGIGIGAANVIPGVSGGTMALIFGIYERLIVVAGTAVRSGVLLLRLDVSGARDELRNLPWMFVLSLGAGIVIAPLLGARFIPDLLELFPEESRATFFGLILGSIAIPWLRIDKPGMIDRFVLVLAALAAFLLAGIPVAQEVDPSLWYVFFAGVIAMSAMILPGISGAYILVILGLYSPIFRAINERDLVMVLVFMAGAGIGVGAFSVFVGWLLRTMHDHTMAVLVGLMVGSLRTLWPWIGPDGNGIQMPNGEPISRVFMFMAMGLLVSGGILAWELHQKRTRTGSNQRTTTNGSVSKNDSPMI